MRGPDTVTPVSRAVALSFLRGEMSFTHDRGDDNVLMYVNGELLAAFSPSGLRQLHWAVNEATGWLEKYGPDGYGA